MKQELSLRSIYSFVLGLLLAIFTGILVNTVFPFDGSNNSLISMLVMLAAVLMVSVGLFLGTSSLEVIANGLLLGSFFTIIYSVGVGFITEDKTIRLIVIFVALVIILVTGYLKFVRGKSEVNTLPPQPPIG